MFIVTRAVVITLRALIGLLITLICYVLMFRNASYFGEFLAVVVFLVYWDFQYFLFFHVAFLREGCNYTHTVNVAGCTEKRVLRYQRYDKNKKRYIFVWVDPITGKPKRGRAEFSCWQLKRTLSGLFFKPWD